MKKILALSMTVIVLSLLAGCSNSSANSSNEYISSALARENSITDIQQSSEFETEAQTIAGTESQATDIEWTEYTYDMKDSDGYEYKVSIKLSPWILYSETSTINEAWSVVGKDKTLPTFDDWGLKRSSDNNYWTPYSHGTAAFDRGSWNLHMNDMYYCVGNISIKNTTEGWNITSNTSRTAKAQMVYQPYNGNDAIPSMAKAFYGNSTDKWWHGIDISAKMKSNNWGPVPFVFMSPENFSPNSPNGEHIDTLRTGCFEPFGITNPEPIYVDIIGKNGEKFSPIKEKE